MVAAFALLLGVLGAALSEVDAAQQTAQPARVEAAPDTSQAPPAAAAATNTAVVLALNPRFVIRHAEFIEIAEMI